MQRWMGLIGSWALLVLALGILGYALTAEAINLRDSANYREYQRINKIIGEWKEERLAEIEREMETSAERVSHLEGEVESKEAEIRDLRDTKQVITVSTEENKVYLRRDGEVIFEAVASTGKGFTRLAGGKVRDFATPVGRFRIISKEENPVWVPPDWHYLEKSANVVRLNRGSVIGTPDHHLKVVGNNVVRVSNGMQTTLPQGQEIYFGGAIVIPPIGTQQRRYPDVLGTRRLNLGDGYALHGTQAVSQLGQSVSHGCIRLRNADIEKLYEMVNVGDEVVIY
jgi:hypothetical protein